jgi:hypothetical protein
VKDKVHTDHGKAAATYHRIQIRGMPSQTGIHIGKAACLRHKSLTASLFFAGTAIKAHGAGQVLLLQIFRQRHRRAKGAGTQIVVAASVTTFLSGNGTIFGRIKNTLR